jgi:hypothetical protein
MQAPKPLRQTPFLFIALGLAMVFAACSAASQQSRPAVPIAPDEPVVTAEMIGPLTKETPLQIVSLFSYEPGETLISPAAELASFVAEKRARGDFGKEPLRMLLLDPPPSSIKAQKLLYIALGPRAEFSVERVRQVGAAAMREALAVGAEHMAFAPVVRDQGVTTFSADDAAVAFIDGALFEWSTEMRANPQVPARLKAIAYEAGPAFIEAVKKAVPRGIQAAHARLQAAQAAP